MPQPRHWSQTIICLAAFFVGATAFGQVCTPDWIGAMDTLNDGFNGLEFYVGKAGSNEFASPHFWAPLAGPGLDLAGHPWQEEIDALLTPNVFGTTGPEYVSPAAQVGRHSSWHIDGEPSPLDQLLSGQPEAVLCMVGTNDILGTDESGSIWPSYQANLETIVQEILIAGSIPMLVTIHPQVDREELVQQVNAIICSVAMAHNVPLVDFNAEVLALQPTGWYGTIVAADGINLSNGTGQPGDFNPANLSANGYALLNFVCLRTFSEVYRNVLTSTPSPVLPNSILQPVLGPAVPNPFNPTTEITFLAPRGRQTTVTVHDLRGREIALLFDGQANGGSQSLTWNATGLASGVYFVRVISGNETATEKIALLK